jgi:peptidyl-prolyl cis-trans isomerase A (cyclophilin A)
VRFVTSLGVMDVALCTGDAPDTVDNFLGYVDSGAYTDSGFLHRSVQTPGCEQGLGICIIQGGGFYIDDDLVMQAVVEGEQIVRENTGPNVRFSIAMARQNEPDTATSQWFINAKDNPILDEGGYAVFGEVVRGRGVATLIAKQATWSLNDRVLSETPLIAYPDDGSSHLDYLVYVTSVERLPEPSVGLQAGAALTTLVLLARGRGRRRRGTSPR